MGGQEGVRRGVGIKSFSLSRAFLLHTCSHRAVYTRVIRRYTAHYYRAQKGQLGAFASLFSRLPSGGMRDGGATSCSFLCLPGGG